MKMESLLTSLKTSPCVITVAIASILLLACSTNEPLKARYEAEQLFFEAEKLAKEAYIKPELGTGQDLKRIFDAYDRVLNFTLASLETVDSNSNLLEYSELSSLAHRSATRLTKMYFAEKNFDTCITLMSTTLEQTRLAREEKIAVYYNLGQALQADGQFDSAITIYTYTIETFNPPLTQDGQPILEILNLPMFLVRIFTQLGDTTQARESFDDAETYYSNLLESFPGSNLAMTANGNLARLYYDSRLWDESISYLSKMVDSTGQVTLSARFRIADIQATFQKKYARAMASLDQILRSLQGRDTVFVPVARFKKGLVEMKRGRTSRARKILAEIQKSYPGYDRANPRVQYMKARSFDLENNWDRAETEYKFLIERHGESREGLATYMYLADQLAQRGRKNESEQWYDKALRQYTLLAARGSGTLREAIALTYKADLYRSQERWKDAASTLTTIYEKFSDSPVGRDCLLTAAEIYRRRLDDPVTADSLISELKKNVPAESPEWDS